MAIINLHRYSQFIQVPNSNEELLFQVVTDFIIPIILAIVTYLLVDRMGEWKKRKNYSRLGIAIIESLQEEVKTGIRIMTNALSVAINESLDTLPIGSLPNKSWNGMATIPDEVLLRIIATSEKGKFDGLPPRECRIHCKNYFEHMNANYDNALKVALNQAKQGQNWSQSIQTLLADDTGHYIQATKGVDQMLEQAKKLLERNAKSWFPK